MKRGSKVSDRIERLKKLIITNSVFVLVLFLDFSRKKTQKKV